MSDNTSLSSEQPFATFHQDTGAGEREFPIDSGAVRIGQSAQNEIVLDDDTVSSNHARLEYTDSGWRLTDLESRNGTYIEGARIPAGVPTPVPNNSMIAFGAVALTFRSREDVDPNSVATTPAAGQASVRRAGFRLPVWLVVLVIVIVAALVFLATALSADAPTNEPGFDPAVQASSISLILDPAA